MLRRMMLLLALGSALPAVGCSREEVWRWELPDHFPVPAVPEDNPMSAAKVELGRHLFYDTRLSGDGDMSCASCHQQALAFTDGLGRAVGTTGEVHPRGAMSLTNVAYSPRLAWANPLLARLEHQAMLPMFGEEPVEMGLAGQEEALEERLSADATYQRLLGAAFPGEPRVTVAHITRALAAFQRTLISADSPYDRHLAGDADALNASARRGMELFFSERLECFHCHGGFNFTDSVDHAGMMEEVAFHHTGLYDEDGAGAYPELNPGVMEISGDPADMGRFRAPTLRNIARTAPYMHDGSIATLSGVLDHYAAGGRAAGQTGTPSDRVSEFVPGFLLDEDERSDVIAFLNALTDEAFLRDPRHADPWPESP